MRPTAPALGILSSENTVAIPRRRKTVNGAMGSMRNVSLVLALFSSLLLFPSWLLAQQPCGEERWPVKTLTDQDAGLVSGMKQTTIEQLVKIPSEIAHSMEIVHEYENKRMPTEQSVVTVHALVIGAMRERDHDFHIEIADPNNPKTTMIAEIPDPACGVSPAYRAQVTTARSYFEANIENPDSKFKELVQPVQVGITGVPFFDIIHGANGGQVGHAPNGIEIHPVLSIREEGEKARR